MDKIVQEIRQLRTGNIGEADWFLDWKDMAEKNGSAEPDEARKRLL